MRGLAKTSVVTKRAAAPAAPKSHETLVVDPLTAVIVHAMSIPFDEREREAHLRCLDAALEAQHQHC